MTDFSDIYKDLPDLRWRYDESRSIVADTLNKEYIGETELAMINQELLRRRREDLRGLSADEQISKIKESTLQILPQADFEAKVEHSLQMATPLEIKYGIDPTGSDVHLGHVVPMLILDRLQRMGHNVTFIVGDFTAKIGDPSGKVASRPVLTDEDIAANMDTYASQVRPLFDMDSVNVVYNGEWLNEYPLRDLMNVLSKIQTSTLMQRQDFRNRMDSGSGITQAELLYPVVMALDSVQLASDIEIGGKDQLLNMQMGREVMSVMGQPPQAVITTDILEGTDGSGNKMSKSLGNYVGLTQDPTEIYGRIMSIPDNLLQQYFSMLTELEPSEWDTLSQRMADGLNPMSVKRMLARDIVSVLHDQAASKSAETHFMSKFSRRDYGSVAKELPTLENKPHASTVERIMLARNESRAAIRRLIEGGGVRLIGPDNVEVKPTSLDELEALATSPREYIKVGKTVVRVPGSSHEHPEI